MKTIRTRMLVVFAAAAVIISIFVQWNEMQRGFKDGWQAYAGHTR